MNRTDRKIQKRERELSVAASKYETGFRDGMRYAASVIVLYKEGFPEEALTVQDLAEKLRQVSRTASF